MVGSVLTNLLTEPTADSEDNVNERLDNDEAEGLTPSIGTRSNGGHKNNVQGDSKCHCGVAVDGRRDEKGSRHA